MPCMMSSLIPRGSESTMSRPWHARTAQFAGLVLDLRFGPQNRSLSESRLSIRATQSVSLELVRSLLIFLSRRKLLRKWMETSSLPNDSRPDSGRFHLEQAIASARELTRRNHRHFGRAGRKRLIARGGRPRARCLSADPVGRSPEWRPGNVSLKLSQFGIDLSGQACRAMSANWWNGRPPWTGSSGSTWNPASTSTGRSTWSAAACQIPRGGNGDPGLSVSQQEGYRDAERAGHPRPAVQGRISGTGQRGLPAKGRKWTPTTSN